MKYLLLHPQDLEGLVRMPDAIAAIERAYGEAAGFPQIAAPRQRIHSTAGVRMNAFPGGVEGLGTVGLASHAEVVSQAGEVQEFHNREHQICLLHDSKDAHLLAILIGAINEASLGYSTQTALRTGATSGIGFRYLARPDARTAGLFGAGDQAVTQLLALKCVRPIEKVKVFTRTAHKREAFARRYSSSFGLDIVPVDTPEAAVHGSDVIICATNTNVPVLKGEWLEAGQHVVSIVGSNIALVHAGWLKAPRREVDDATVARADIVAVNSRASVVQDQQGDLFEPIEKGLLKLNDLVEIGEIANGSAPGRTRRDQVTLHKNNAGTGLADVALATVAYEAAKSKGRGTWLELPSVDG